MFRLSYKVVERGGEEYLMARKKPVITVSGLHGVGKSTYAKALSTEFNLRHISAGTLFRKIAKERGMSIIELTKFAERHQEIDKVVDTRMKGEARRGSIVLDGVLTGWMVPNADVKIFLEALEEARIQRIAKRDGLTYKEAEKTTTLRERVERRRFKKYYGIDVSDRSTYDVIVDTNLLPIDSTIEILKEVIRRRIQSKGGER